MVPRSTVFRFENGLPESMWGRCIVGSDVIGGAFVKWEFFVPMEKLDKFVASISATLLISVFLETLCKDSEVYFVMSTTVDSPLRIYFISRDGVTGPSEAYFMKLLRLF